MYRLNGIITYNGFGEPKNIADSIAELIDSITIEHNYTGDATADFIELITDEVSYSGASIYMPISILTSEQLGEINEQISGYGVYICPTIEELQDFNESVCLDRNAYLTDHMQEVESGA